MAFKNIFFLCSEIDLSTSKSNVTGQSVISKYIYEIFKNEYQIKLIKHLNKSTFSKSIFIYIKQLLSIIFDFEEYKLAYFVLSRSKYGFFRDAIFLIIFNLKKIRCIVHIHGSDVICVRNYSFYIKII